MFKDHFSKQSDIYVKYRPKYPPELFSYLSSLTESHDLAWDCGTGNGQAAIGLTSFYKNIIATDPSEQQIKNAFANEKVKYLIERAEQSSIVSDSVDLLTIANALHWFDFEIFYKEAKRVLKKNGFIAAWSNGAAKISAEINEIIDHYHDHTLNDYWLDENRLIEKQYSTIPFPFHEIVSPQFYFNRNMNLHNLIGYINTWSATQRFIKEKGFDPTEQLMNDLAAVWQDPLSEKTLTWKLILKVGRVV